MAESNQRHERRTRREKQIEDLALRFGGGSLLEERVDHSLAIDLERFEAAALSLDVLIAVRLLLVPSLQLCLENPTLLSVIVASISASIEAQ